jgi:hypothetical protein
MRIASYRMLIAILVTLTRARGGAADFGSVQFSKMPGCSPPSTYALRLGRLRTRRRCQW